MIALDTNVLVRFLVEDDEKQTAAAARLIAKAKREGEPLFVTDVTLVEVVWVLATSYRVERREIVRVVGELLHTKELVFRSRPVLMGALSSFAGGKADFADYVIRELAREGGAGEVATFDRALLKEEGFVSRDLTWRSGREKRVSRNR